MSTSKSLYELVHQRDLADRQRAELQAQIDSHKQVMTKLLVAVKKACKAQKISPLDVAVALLEESGAAMPGMSVSGVAVDKKPAASTEGAPPKRRGRPPKAPAAAPVSTPPVATKSPAPSAHLQEVLPPMDEPTPTLEAAPKSEKPAAPKKATSKKAAKKTSSLAKQPARQAVKKSAPKTAPKTTIKAEVLPDTALESATQQEKTKATTKANVPPAVVEVLPDTALETTAQQEKPKRPILHAKKAKAENQVAATPAAEELPPTVTGAVREELPPSIEPEGSPFKDRYHRTPIEYTT